MSGVRVQRLMRLIDESRPFQQGSDGHAAIRKLEMAYHEICLLAETSLMELNAGKTSREKCCPVQSLIRVLLLHCHQLFDQVGIRSPRTEAYGLLLRAYLQTKQAQRAAAKGVMAVDQHVEALSFVEKALAIADEVTHFYCCRSAIADLKKRVSHQNLQEELSKVPRLWLRQQMEAKAIEDAMQLCVEAKATHGHSPQWDKHHYILQRKLAMIRGGLGGRQDASGPIPTKAEFPHWASTVETAISAGRLAVKTAQAAGSVGSQRENAAGLKGESMCNELLKAWSILDPQLPQVVRNAFITRGTLEEVDDHICSLQKSVEPARTVGENEHFAGYLVVKAALAQRFFPLARVMTKALERWQAGTTSAAVLQRMLEIETELRLREFLCELRQQEGTSFSAPSGFSLLSSSAREPCPIRDLRVQAVRRLDECLTAMAHFKNPVLATSCVVESEPSRLADLRPLSLSLEQMAHEVSQLTLPVENSSPVEQIQNIALRGRHEHNIAKIIGSAEDLRRRAFQMLADEESKICSRQLRAEPQGTSKRAAGSQQQSRASLYRKPMLSLRGESTIKKIIASYGHLVSRARVLGDDRATARAATAILSMIHGTEKCLDPAAFNNEVYDTTPPVDLRVRLRPPFEIEVAVHVIEAAYALALCCSKLKTPGTPGNAEVITVGPAFEDSDLQEEQPLLSKGSGSGSTMKSGDSALAEEQRAHNLLLFGARLRDGSMWAIRHLLQACEYGKEANCVPLLLFAARALWNAAAPVIGDENNGDQAYLAVKTALYTIPTSCRPAATTLITRMCMGLLWSLPYCRKWDELFRTAEAAMLLVPKVLHTPLMKLQILALTRTETPNLFPTVCSLARSEPSSEADLLHCFARLAQKTPGLTSVVMEAYEGASSLFEVDKDPHGIVVHLEVAEWLLSTRRSWAKASSHIRAALELLKRIECQQEDRLPWECSGAENGGQTDSATCSTSLMSLNGTVIRLDHLLLLQAQALKLFYSPDTSETADAMRQIVTLSSQMLEAPARSASEKTRDQDIAAGEGLTKSVGSSGEQKERANQQLDPWASASLYDPIRLGEFGSRDNRLGAADGTCLNNSNVGKSGDRGGLGSLLTSRMHRNAGTIRDILLWSTSLTLAFRILNKTEAHLFELGLETWALRLTRLRAKIAEAFLLLSLQSNSSTSTDNGFGTMHPAISLLEASFNIQVFRGAVACRFLDEAQKLQPFFSPSALRAWLGALGPATEAGEGFSTAMGRQACCFSVVTLHPSLYLPSPQVLKDCNPNLYARQTAMLAMSRFRQGDVDSSLQLLDTVTSLQNFPQLELPVGLDVADSLWKIHAAKGTISKALPVMKQIEATLSELASATATGINFEKGATIVSRVSSSHWGSQQTAASTTTRIEKGGKASCSSNRMHQSRYGRGAATAEVPQWPLSLTVWKHRLKGLEADHFFSLHCLGWTAEGGSLHIHWKRTFLEAVNLLSSLLDRTEGLGVPLKPLRVCASSCLRGARFLMAAMRFLWADEKNFSAYHWERRERPLAVSPNPSGPPLVTPADLHECSEALHRVLAGLDLEARAVLDFVTHGNKYYLTHQSALAWADMIALASAQLLCFRHQLQLVTLEFWRADIHQVLEGSQRLFVGTSGVGASSAASNFIHAKSSADERRRALQQWLYESQYEDAVSSSQMKSQQQWLERAVQELEAMRTVGLCRRQTDKKYNCSEIWGKSLLDVLWACQCAMLRHQQSLLQARQRIIEQGRELHDLCPWIQDETEPQENREFWIEDIRSAADKTPKGQQRSLNYLASAWARDPREGRCDCIASPELEQTFLSCIVSGHLTEATFLGEELITNVFGNGNLEQLDRGFATIVTLQAAQVAQASRLLQLQFTSPHMAESVATQELRILEESWREAGAVPQMQVIRRMLDSRVGFMQMANLSDLAPSTVLNSWLPRNICVACLHCAKGFVFFAAACPVAPSDGCPAPWRFFLQRRALPECLLLNTDDAPVVIQDPVGNKDIPNTSSASSFTYPDQVYAVLEDLFEELAAQMLYWSLAAILNQGQSATLGEPRSHLLLLPDIRLSHFPFERLPTLNRLFGHRITRDFSLHMFARRMQHHEAVPAASQPRKTVAEMHTGFARESLLLLPESTTYPNLQNVADNEHEPGAEEDQSDMPFADDEPRTATELESPHASLSKTVISPLLTPPSYSSSDWRLAVVAELGASKRSASADAIPGVPPATSFVPELLCSKSPQVAWIPSVDRMVRNCEDLNYAFAGMNLTHISLLGLVSMRCERPQPENGTCVGRRSDYTLYCQEQKVLGLSKGTETILMLSVRVAQVRLRFCTSLGVGTIAAVDEILTDQQKVDLTKRFLTEVAGAQTQICSALESLSSSSVEGGRTRFSTKRNLRHKIEQTAHERFTSSELPDSKFGADGSKKEAVARGMRIYGLPWISRLASQKSISKAELQKVPAQRGRK
ncbi:subtilisin-like protease, putative [Eimeria mitis]|uniref:Subtilisin-like protease, putative n=1 Tax=Eimeria mitis TaxID=44415 RepID=U6KKJ2_9EIME|nr:subtilisin-like protease, putative [Eimeria mitis]CDJ35963.1 subtilisin-like protease, putative [Eimeria mitis]